MTRETIDRLRELEAKATKGPWISKRTEAYAFDDHDARMRHLPVAYLDGPYTMGDGETGYMTPETGALVAESRNALSELLDMAEAVRRSGNVVLKCSRCKALTIGAGDGRLWLCGKCALGGSYDWPSKQEAPDDDS